MLVPKAIHQALVLLKVSQNPSINFCSCQVTLLNFMITVVGLQALHSRSVVALVALNLSDIYISATITEKPLTQGS